MGHQPPWLLRWIQRNEIAIRFECFSDHVLWVRVELPWLKLNPYSGCVNHFRSAKNMLWLRLLRPNFQFSNNQQGWGRSYEVLQFGHHETPLRRFSCDWRKWLLCLWSEDFRSLSRLHWFERLACPWSAQLLGRRLRVFNLHCYRLYKLLLWFWVEGDRRPIRRSTNQIQPQRLFWLVPLDWKSRWTSFDQKLDCNCRKLCRKVGYSFTWHPTWVWVHRHQTNGAFEIPDRVDFQLPVHR